MKLGIALIAGMLFGGGLVVSGMTDTAKVQIPAECVSLEHGYSQKQMDKTGLGTEY